MTASPTVTRTVLSQAAAAGDATAPAWRVRWFWRWQAWRLRHARIQESGSGVALYDSLRALDQRGHVEDFCNLHRQLIREAPLAGLDSPIGFSRRLARELQGACTMAVLAAPDGRPGGYAWGRSGTLDDALGHYQQVLALNHLRSDEWKELQRRAAAAVGGAPLLAINGIGLAPPYRKGFAPLKLLLKPLLDRSLQHGVWRAIWWVPRASALHAMSLGFGADVVLQTPRIVCFLLADTRPLARVFAALPASGIADLLARVAPARPPLRGLPRQRAVPRPKPDGEAAA